MLGCRIRFSLVRAATLFTALTIPASARRRRHGCVRLSLGNAATLFALVSARGVSKTKVVVRGPDPRGYHVATQIPQRRPGRLGFLGDSSVNWKPLLGGASGAAGRTK